MWHSDNLAVRRVSEMMMTPSHANHIPAVRFEYLDDIATPQISPIARMLVRP
jgi:hypothetical protein